MPHPGEYLRLCPLQHNSCTKTKKCGPNERKDQNSRKRTSDEELANLSDAEFKTLVIRMLTEMVEYGCKIKEKVKVMQSEIKKIYRETTGKVRKPELELMISNKRKK